jgi:hypothetical protein
LLPVTKKLDHDIDIVARNQRRRIARDQFRRQPGHLVRLETSIGNARQLERHTQDAPVLVAIAQQQLDHAAAHSSASEQGQADSFQLLPRSRLI